MARIVGVNIPPKKHLVISLRAIYGIGQTTSENICDELGIPREKKVFDLSEEEEISLNELINRKYIVENVLREKKAKSIRRLISIRCFRGLRHLNKLPVRGQRSHTNAKTRKLGIN